MAIAAAPAVAAHNMMPIRSALDRLLQQETINFTLTNRLPRRALTRLAGWLTAIEQPIVRDCSIAAWRFFAGDPQLHEARKTDFTSLHDCFTRQLKDGARPIDQSADVLVSPCDGVVGAFGRVQGTRLFQAKGMRYTLDELLTDRGLVDQYRDGSYVTLRLTASMYHRFHAPFPCEVTGIRYISGDTWNVNPIALKRVARLFCQNERVVVPLRLEHSKESVTLVPVGAILVASIQLNFLDEPLSLKYRGPSHINCQARFSKGDEMGYFRHGSTILVLATRGLRLVEPLREGDVVRMGSPLLRHS